MQASYLPELPEAQASGDIAHIYAEIRRLGAVPMAALIFRHLATMPGALEWAWAAIGPSMAAGRIQERAWRIAGEIRLEPIAPMTRQELAAVGVDNETLASIHAVVESYNRANPVNLLAITCLAKMADGSRASGHAASFAASWAPPPALGEIPPMIDVTRMPGAVRELLFKVASRSTQGATPIVPSLYRHFGDMPQFLALAVTRLLPRFDDGSIARSVTATRATMDAAAEELILDMQAPLAPDAGVVRAFERFRPLIPEMISVGTLLKGAIPP